MLIGIPGIQLPISIIAAIKRRPIRGRIRPYLMEIIRSATFSQFAGLLYWHRSNMYASLKALDNFLLLMYLNIKRSCHRRGCREKAQ
jgi:hypothetical protein